MRLLRLVVEGWMPFAGRFVLTLPAGPIAIVGMHGGDARRSNRAGKTALLEAVTWCFYGVHRKRLDDAVINRESEYCEVRVTTETLEVKRVRKRGTSTKLTVKYEGNDYTGDAAQEVVVRALGLSLNDYLATRCFKQGDVDAIIRRTAGERLTLVSEWLQQHKWMNAKRIQAAGVSKLEGQLNEKRAAANAVSVRVLNDSLVTALINEAERARQSIRRRETTIDGLSIRLKQCESAKSQLELHDEVERLRLMVTDRKAKLATRAKVTAELAQANEARDQATTGHASSSRALQELRAVHAAGFDGICPVSCDACPVSDEVTLKVRESSELYNERSQAERLARGSLAQARERANSAASANSALERAKTEYDWCIARGKEVAAQITMTREEAGTAAKSEELVHELEESRARCNEAIAKVSEIETMLKMSEDSAAQHVELEAGVRDAERALQVGRLALKAISSVPARIAAEQLTELEGEVNVLLQGTGATIRFSWERELGDKAPVCDSCGFVYKGQRDVKCLVCNVERGHKTAQELEVLCDDGSGIEEDVRYNSGGTRAIVGAAIRLGASAMLSRLRSSPATWAIVDEPFGQLDAENREKLARTFAGMLDTVGLDQALVVSHDPALLGALPSRIVVDKDGSHSTLRVE